MLAYMSVMRFDVILPYYTNLPRDVAVNTFHFQRTAGWDDGVANDIAEDLKSFYNTVTSSTSIAGYISPIVNRGASACTIKGYDLSDSEPRPPRLILPWTLGPNVATTGLPNEVAICSSYKADTLAGMSMARRRGRIFLGPLTSGAIQMATTGNPVIVNPSAIARIVERTEWLADQWNPLSEAPWSVYSRVNNAAYAIVEGWVNNEPDTQRRRQARETGRTTWSNL